MANERLVTPAQYDVQIERLTRDRAVAKERIENPAQLRGRHERRALLLGRAMTTGGYRLSKNLMDQVLSRAGDDSIFWPEVLEADGWTLEEDGRWRLPTFDLLDE